MRLVQLSNVSQRRVAVVDEPHLRLLGPSVRSVVDLAQEAQRQRRSLAELAGASTTKERLLYDEVYEGRSEWRLLPAACHPDSGWRTLVSGTGLTHLASVKRRDAMHAAAAAEQETDSMKMYRWGVEGGKPSPHIPGAAPEWFYKGNGSTLRAHGEPLEIPGFAEDGGEEPEIAGVYLIDAEGIPRRLGMAIGNEFSDHRFERRNYLYLAHSKLRTCSIGPELVLDPNFGRVAGEVRIERNAQIVWSSPIRSGEEVMCHSLANIEHHHFKYPQHRLPGDVHIHFFGADAFSFGDGIELADNDVMHVAFDGFGRPLRNPVRRSAGPAAFWAARDV